MARETTLIFLLIGLLSPALSAARADEPAICPDSLRTYATLHSLGFEWDVTGDSDHDAICGVRYRASGTSAWRDGLGLLRVDYDGYYADTRADRAYDMLAGSLFFLDPGTAYEVELTLEDPDGGGVQRIVELATRSAPVLPRGPVAYVHADTTSGDGTRERPLTFADALARKWPGAIYCLLPGRYGQARLECPGEPDAPIAWLGPQAARHAGWATPEGEAIFERLEIEASHVWIEGLLFDKAGAWPDSVTRGGLKGLDAAAGVVVRGNRFLNYHYSIWLSPGNSAWVISDNTIVGRKDIEQEGSASFSGEGIELQHSSDHTVAYNSISQVADGISYAQRNVDIFGNDIFDTFDDASNPTTGTPTSAFGATASPMSSTTPSAFRACTAGPGTSCATRLPRRAAHCSSSAPPTAWSSSTTPWWRRPSAAISCTTCSTPWCATTCSSATAAKRANRGGRA